MISLLAAVPLKTDLIQVYSSYLQYTETESSVKNINEIVSIMGIACGYEIRIMITYLISMLEKVYPDATGKEISDGLREGITELLSCAYRGDI